MLSLRSLFFCVFFGIGGSLAAWEEEAGQAILWEGLPLASQAPASRYSAHNNSIYGLSNPSSIFNLVARQQCNPGYWYCSQSGNCCPSNLLCCDTGYCVESGGVCCPNSGTCPPGQLCCKNSDFCVETGGECCGSTGTCQPGWGCCEGTHCYPLDGQCCRDGSYCTKGNICVIVNSSPVPVCCTDLQCTAYVDGSTTMSKTPPKPSPTPPAPITIFPSTTHAAPETIITGFQLYSMTITWYYYSYYLMFYQPLSTTTVTSTEITTTTVISALATDSADAYVSLLAISATASLPTPMAATTALSALNGLHSPTPTTTGKAPSSAYRHDIPIRGTLLVAWAAIWIMGLLM